jgi:RNA polymerase sigma-70 factor (ECF subfamily)
MKETMVLEEASIISLMRAGNTDAFTDIVECYQVAIQRYLYRLTGDYELARDLTQDTFILAYKGILKTDADIALKAWLYRIATNNARQSLRRKRLLSFIPFSKWGKADVASCEDGIGQVLEKIAIRDALLKVPQEQRFCMVLHFIEGFKYREIAETLGISEEAVRKRVARGSDEFRRQYGPRGGV